LERRYLPRVMPFDALIGVLVAEHATMKDGLRRVREAAEKSQFEEASAALKELEGVFRQHIADEEAQIVRLLVGELGVKGAEEEIKVFQQHRPIYRLIQAVSELASMKGSELAAEQTKLAVLFEEHTTAEEGRVFPKALRCYESRGKA